MSSFLSDYLNLNYDKCPNKIRTIRDIINRLSSGEMDKIINSIKTLSEKIDSLDKQVQNLDKRWNDVEKTFTKEQEVSNKPDLIVKSISTNIILGVAYIEIEIQNIGYATSSECKLNVVIYESSDVILDVPILGIDETVMLYHQYSFDPLSEISLKTVVATVDSTNIIDEIKEFNNTKSVSFNAGQPYGINGFIFHVHNPEGKEIGSILYNEGLPLSFIITLYNYQNSSSISITAPPFDAESHGIPIPLSVGNYKLTVLWNGITVEQNFHVNLNEVTEIFLFFTRTSNLILFDCPNNGFLEEGQIDGSTYPHIKSGSQLGIPWSWQWYANVLMGDTNDIFSYLVNAYWKLSSSGFSASVVASYAHQNEYINDIILYSVIESNNLYPLIPNPQNIIDTQLPPKNPNFSVWFIQRNLTGDYPRIILRDTPYSGYFVDLLDKNYNNRVFGYQMITIPANRNWTSMEAIYSPSIDITFWIEYQQSNSAIKTLFGELSIIAMSSVPYDILGIAI